MNYVSTPTVAQRSGVVHANTKLKLLPCVRAIARAHPQRRAIEVARRAIHRFCYQIISFLSKNLHFPIEDSSFSYKTHVAGM